MLSEHSNSLTSAFVEAVKPQDRRIDGHGVFALPEHGTPSGALPSGGTVTRHHSRSAHSSDTSHT